jgi:glucose-6-phosphate isomerase
MEPLRHHTAWKALSTHYEAIERLHLRDLFARDPGRGERLTAEGVGLFLDFSKNRITDRTIELLIELAEESGLRSRIDAMFRGDKINITENRAVLHVALRAPKDASIVVDGENVVSGVHAVLERMTEFSNRVRSGDWKDTPAGAFATSSTLVSGAQTWGRPWPSKPSSITATER